jgi:hypothetical protein
MGMGMGIFDVRVGGGGMATVMKVSITHGGSGGGEVACTGKEKR